ncbi:hypothetical protein Tco_1078625 [Tanacetum coccineum]|uniref:Uncharacterized protein n=1 Tax=Tanacetum coccineum TaxID=301880 RepID=A0ABQ5HQ38_9ASTR
MARLPTVDQRHLWLRYLVPDYTPAIVHSYKQRLATIWSRPVNRIHAFVNHAWRRLFSIKAPLVQEFVLEFFSTCRMGDTVMELDTPNTLCFQLGGVRHSMSWRQFILAMGLHTEEEMAKVGFKGYWTRTSSYVHIRDPVRRLCHRMISYTVSGRGQGPKKVAGVDLFYLQTMDHGTANVPYLLARYLFHFSEGRKGVPDYLADEGDETAAEDAPKIPTPALAQAPPPPPALQPRTIAQMIDKVEEEVHGLCHDITGLRVHELALILTSAIPIEGQSSPEELGSGDALLWSVLEKTSFSLRP